MAGLCTITTPDGAPTSVNPMLVRCVKQKNEKVVMIIFDQSHYIEALGTVPLVSQKLSEQLER
jgi:hypothetical protein